MNVLVTGSLSFDFIMDFPGLFADRIMPDKIHRISFAPLVDTLFKQFGGTAGNIAYSLALLGEYPLIVAPVGNDFTPYGNFLDKHHISSRYIKIFDNESTGHFFVVTDKEDSQIGAFYKGALRFAPMLSLLSVKEKAALVIIGPTEPEAMKKYVKECQDNKFEYLYDPAFQIADFSRDALFVGIKGAQILIGNDYEIALIEKKLGISHEELIVSVPILITTIGSKGSIIETRNDAIHVKPAQVKNTSDPTGAGDAYRAGFVAGYIHHFGLAVCGQMGSVAAAYTVEQYGTVTHHFTKKEFIRRYKENYEDTLIL